MNKKEKKEAFLDALADCLGIIETACARVKIARKTYYQWRKKDPEFAAKADEIEEAKKDFVEGKLLTNINNGDTTSIIFFLKTKCKDRGYTEKNIPQPKADGGGRTQAEIDIVKKRAAGVKSSLVKKLKAADRYSILLEPQLDVAAATIVERKMLHEEMLADSKKSVSVEISREGNERLVIDPRLAQYKELLKIEQEALKALGMDCRNIESESGKSPLEELMNALKG